MLDSATLVISSVAIGMVLILTHGAVLLVDRANHIVLYTLAWLSGSVAYALRLIIIQSGETPFLIALNYLFSVGITLFVYLGCHRFLGVPVRKWWLLSFIFSVFAFLVPLLFGHTSPLTLAPTYVLTATTYSLMAMAFLLTDRTQGSARLIAAASFLIWAVVVAAFPLLQVLSLIPDSVGYILAPINGTLVAMALLAVHFQSVREELQRQEGEARYHLLHDRVTGLCNRTHLEQYWGELSRDESLPLSVVMADLNSLKRVNDTMGHQMGDRLIRMAARVLTSVSRDGDVIVRWGGDEFLMLLPRTREKEAATIIDRAKRICAMTRKPGLSVEMALGYATRTDLSEEFDALLRRAEARMYSDKAESDSTKRSS